MSVIDLSGRDELTYLSDVYIEALKRIAEFIKVKGYDIKILSLYDFEWDDKTANELKEFGEIVKYNNNLDFILSLIAGANCVIGSRVHAITCAIAAGVHAVPIYYDEKLLHVVKDMDDNFPCFDIRNIAKISADEIFSAMKYESQANIPQLTAQIVEELNKIKVVLD